jgi:phosphoglycolate phosphatase-like HAD superfamily hydrolase
VLCLVFDVDDTIVEYAGFDPVEWYRMVGERAARELGVPMNHGVWRAMIAGKMSRRYSERYGVPAEEFWALVDRYNLEYRVNMNREGRIRLYEDARVIPELEYPKIAWSSASRDCALYSLSAVGARDWFLEVYGKDYQNYRFIDSLKPEAGLLKELLRTHGCDKCVVVGDSDSDIEAARKAECRGIRINRGAGKEGIDSLWLLSSIL